MPERFALVSRSTIDRLAQLAQVVDLDAYILQEADLSMLTVELAREIAVNCACLCHAIAALHMAPDAEYHPPTDRCPPPDDDECPATVRGV